MFNFRFLTKQRIRSAAAFDTILKTGKRSSLSCFALCVKQNGLGFPRLGIMIGKRYCPRAVDRNRLKRLVREYFRQHQSQLHDFDYVFLSRSTVKALSDQEQVTCIVSLFEQCIAQLGGPVSN